MFQTADILQSRPQPPPATKGQGQEVRYPMNSLCETQNAGKSHQTPYRAHNWACRWQFNHVEQRLEDHITGVEDWNICLDMTDVGLESDIHCHRCSSDQSATFFCLACWCIVAEVMFDSLQTIRRLSYLTIRLPLSLPLHLFPQVVGRLTFHSARRSIDMLPGSLL